MEKIGALHDWDGPSGDIHLFLLRLAFFKLNQMEQGKVNAWGLLLDLQNILMSSCRVNASSSEAFLCISKASHL